MTEYAYNYHDLDPCGHKRQRIGSADQHLWPANEVLVTDLTPHAVYDPVRDILHDGTTLADSSCFDFTSASLNDSSLWYSEPGPQLVPEPYSFEDQNALPTSQPFYEQTTAAFRTSFRDEFNEPLGDFQEDITETNVHEPGYSLDIGESPPQGPIVICFGMVRPTNSSSSCRI